MRDRHKKGKEPSEMNAFLHDMRYALRMIRKGPALSGIIILTLALAIGANTAIYSVIHTVFFHSLPFRDQQQIVRLGERDVRSHSTDDTWIRTSYLNFLEWKAQSQVFEGMAVYDGKELNLTSSHSEPERIAVSSVSQDFFMVTGVYPRIGRSFYQEEYSRKSSLPAIISNALWTRCFNRQPDLLGQTVYLEGRPYTVIGVMPPQFKLYWEERPIEAWTPMTSEYAQSPRKNKTLSCLARLKSGIPLERAQADMRIISERLAVLDSDANREWTARVGFVKSQPLEEVQKNALWILLAAVGLILCIASTNVANLLLSRASHREREISIRAALGASRSRIIKQMLAESCLIAGLGGIAGLMLAQLGILLINAFCEEADLFWPLIRLDWNILGFTTVLTLLVGILFGLAPVWHSLSLHLQDSLRSSSAITAQRKTQQRLKSLLVISEVTLSLLLLIGAFLLVRSFYNLLQTPLGFRTDQLLTISLNLDSSQFSQRSKQLTFFQQALERIKLLPGVESAALTSSLPLSGREAIAEFIADGNMQQPRNINMGAFLRGGYLHPSPNDPKVCWWRTVTPDYFKTMGIRLKSGRTFNDFDSVTGMPVVVVSEALARRHWGSENPVGEKVYMEDAFRTVIGVVYDIKHRNPDSPPLLEAYLSLAQRCQPDMYLVMHTRSDPWPLVPLVKKEIFTLNPQQPVSSIRTMERVLMRRLSMRWFLMGLSVLFAAAALFLATIGLYGVMSQFVEQRTQELGIRMAIGASRADILFWVLRRGMSHVLVGLGCGLLAASGIMRWINSQLYKVDPYDPLIVSLVFILLITVSLLACYLPARRATLVDPLVSLRYE
jgi:putative ABC transport system permease protein